MFWTTWLLDEDSCAVRESSRSHSQSIDSVPFGRLKWTPLSSAHLAVHDNGVTTVGNHI